MTPSNWINYLAPASGPPPSTVMAFFRWALAGSMPALWLSGLASVLAGVVEVSAVLMLGVLVDAALATSPQNPMSNQVWLLVAGVAFFLLARPVIFGVFSFVQSVVVTPNVFNLVLSRLHRWTLGQSVRFFDNDFAGRIAQKEMQTARAVTDVVVEVVHTVLFALASIVGAALMLTSIDLFLTAGLLGWLAAYLLMIRHFMPLIRRRSAARAGARATVTGQIVDTVTNIKTVKLFAHADHEDRAALQAMSGFRDSSIDYGYISAWFRFCLNALAGVLPVVMVGGSLWFWNTGSVSAGDIAAAGAISLRLSQMTGWVSYTLMTLYANLGEVEDGIQTLSPPHDLTDAPDARPLYVAQAEIVFDGIRFAYGRDIGGVDDISLTIKAGEKVGVVGASGAGKSTLVALLLRLYDTEKGSVSIDGHNLRTVTQ